MRALLILMTVLVGLLAGSWLTLQMTGPAAHLVARKVGQWQFDPHAGATSIDPYTRARLFTTGELPLATGEGYTLRTTRDSSGEPLTSRCAYRLSGPFPPARYWTAMVFDLSGRPIANLADRHGFTSAEIVRAAGARLAIEIGPEPLPGNWIPLAAGTESFLVVLRFYETPLSATATQFDPRALPVLDRTGCLP